MLGTSRPRIVIADDHIIVADAFQKLLSAEFDVVATVHDGRNLISVAHKLQPDIILVDIGMPILNGGCSSTHQANVTECQNHLHHGQS